MNTVKRFLSVVIVLASVFALASCGETTPLNVFDSFISCVKACDHDKAVTYVTEKSSGDRYFGLLRSADNDSKELLQNLYSLIKYTVISEDVEADEAGDEIIITNNTTRTMKLKVRYPDFSRLMILAQSERAVSGSTYVDILNALYSDGTVERYILTADFYVIVIKENGEWKVPLDQNGVRGGIGIFDSMKLTAFAAWLLG